MTVPGYLVLTIRGAPFRMVRMSSSTMSPEEAKAYYVETAFARLAEEIATVRSNLKTLLAREALMYGRLEALDIPL